MKFLSATAVFAAALPSVTEASTSESPKTIKDLSSDRTGSPSSQFTEIIPDGGAEYKISGDVSLSSFSKIPEEIKDPSSAPEGEEDVGNTEESSPDSQNTETNAEENPQSPSPGAQGDASPTPSSQNAESGTEGRSSSTPTTSSSTSSERTQNSAIALRSFLDSLQ